MSTWAEPNSPGSSPADDAICEGSCLYRLLRQCQNFVSRRFLRYHRIVLGTTTTVAVWRIGVTDRVTAVVFPFVRVDSRATAHRWGAAECSSPNEEQF